MQIRVSPSTPLSLALACAFAALAAPAQAQVDPTRMVDTFEKVGGKHEGFRRSGAKGVCASAEFVGSAQGRALSVASAFSGQPVPVIARFSIGGGNPKAPDNTRSQRNLALQFNLPGGETWQMGNISAPVFGASSPEQMLARLETLVADPETKKPNPEKIKAFTDANPEVLLQGKYFASQPVPASYAKVNYWGVHAFAFVDASGKKQYGKWIFEPVGGTQSLTDEEAQAKGPDFLHADLRQRVAAGGVAFDFNLQLAQPGVDDGRFNVVHLRSTPPCQILARLEAVYRSRIVIARGVGLCLGAHCAQCLALGLPGGRQKLPRRRIPGVRGHPGLQGAGSFTSAPGAQQGLCAQNQFRAPVAAAAAASEPAWPAPTTITSYLS